MLPSRGVPVPVEKRLARILSSGRPTFIYKPQNAAHFRGVGQSRLNRRTGPLKDGDHPSGSCQPSKLRRVAALQYAGIQQARQWWQQLRQRQPPAIATVAAPVAAGG